MSITIKSITKENVAYNKEITFEREGEEYTVLLHWDNNDGFDLTFLDEVSPDWADYWEDNNNESLESTLDKLTDEAIEEGE